MTEDEANRKPCIGPAPQNTGAADDRSGTRIYTCRVSACLAWRVDKTNYNPTVSIGHASGKEISASRSTVEEWEAAEAAATKNGYVPAEPAGYYSGVAMFWQKRQDEPHGYCGWAGKP